MKKLFFLLIAMYFAFSSVQAHAQSKCPVPTEQIVTVLGNNMLTSEQGMRKLNAQMRIALGDEYSNQKLGYDMAYNYDDYAFQEFLQTATSSNIPFDSQVMALLNQLQTQAIPSWFNSLMVKLQQKNYPSTKGELIDQVAEYKRSIQSGSKVIIISLLQGNGYAKLVRDLLAAELTAEQMHSFSIVEMPLVVSNTGGISAPDFKYNPAIIDLLKGLAQVPQPPTTCMNYHQYFASQYDGTYQGACYPPPSSPSFERQVDTVTAKNGIVTTALTGHTFNLADEKGLLTLVNGKDIGGTSSLQISNTPWQGGLGFRDNKYFGSNACVTDDPQHPVSPTYPNAPLKGLANLVISTFNKYRGGFLPGQCKVTNINGKDQVLNRWMPVMISNEGDDSVIYLDNIKQTYKGGQTAGQSVVLSPVPTTTTKEQGVLLMYGEKDAPSFTLGYNYTTGALISVTLINYDGPGYIRCEIIP